MHHELENTMNFADEQNPITEKSKLSRRQLMVRGAAFATATPAVMWSVASVAHALNQRDPLNRYPRMVHEFFVNQVRQAGRVSHQRIADLKTKEDALRHVEETRQRIRQSFGPEPERTPLNARVTKVTERDAYRIENVIFESRPGFPVTANVYVPKKFAGPFPAVVGTCGHSTNGKAAEAYQSFAQGLARLGYLCLIYDPIGQGERLQYPTDDPHKSHIGVGVREHLYAGNQQFLVGEFLGSWRAWDGQRAVDYLETREDVDASRIGVTGNSGGGTMTTWLCGVEDRWSMAAPSCFVTTFRRNMENELPADTEQCPPLALALGLDHCDFLAAMAPKPVIILAKEKDFFDVRGSLEAYERLRRLYSLLDAEENIGLFIGPTPHGYSQENREAMYSWFQKATAQKVSGDSDGAQFGGVLRTDATLEFQPEPEITIEEEETLWCTPKGQIGWLEGTRSVFNFTSDLARLQTSNRKKLEGDDLQAAVKKALKLEDFVPRRPDASIYRALGNRDYPKKSATAYGVESEPGVQAIVYRLYDERHDSRPPRQGEKALLYVAHLSSDEELRSEPLIKDLVESNPDVPFFTCDVRGIGESIPDTCSPNSFHNPYGNDYFYAIHSLMLDRPYVGQKTLDVLRVLDWLKSIGHTNVHLVGRGWGALPATFAALLSDQVQQVTLKNALKSYGSIAESEEYNWPLSSFIPNVLTQFDLPECYQQLNAKMLTQIDPWDAAAGG